MRTLDFSSRGFWTQLNRFCQTARVPDAIRDAVAAILEEVRTKGDQAVAHYVERFDLATLRPPEFKIRPEAMAAAARRLTAAQRAALRDSLRCVQAFNRRSLPRGWKARNPHGAKIGETFYPLQRVGIYVPKGLVSTVIMTATLARIAGVPEIAVFTPCDAEGRVGDGVLAALHFAGVTEAYRIGGVQAVGAMAFGTRTIAPVVKIFGPGNAYVVEAKRQVFGQVGVDLLPGPSEVMVLADGSANPAFVAADLLAQAEHGSGREKIFLVADDKDVIARIHGSMREQLAQLSRADTIREVMRHGFVSVRVDNFDQAAEVANYVAPEHLELEVDSSRRRVLTKSIRTAGAIMQGGWSATALGDFTAGPSHELPTGRAGRFSSGLQVIDFMRRSSLVEYDAISLKRAASVVTAFAELEKLDGHGRSVSIRTESYENKDA